MFCLYRICSHPWAVGSWQPAWQAGSVSSAPCPVGACTPWPWLVVKLVEGLKLCRPLDSQKCWAQEAATGKPGPRGRRGSGRASPLHPISSGKMRTNSVPTTSGGFLQHSLPTCVDGHRRLICSKS